MKQTIQKTINELELEKLSSFYGEFKKFISKGNVIDMAVGVMIGGAFGKIVNSMVADVLMPLISMWSGNVNLKDMKLICRAATPESPEIAIKYGNFLQVTLDFLIVALTLFLILKLFFSLKNRFDNPPVITPAAPPPPSDEVVLLTEIRDLLKK